MGSIFEDPFENCSQDQPVRKPSSSDQLLVSASILYLLCIIILIIGLHYKSKHFPNLSEMYHQSDLIRKCYLTRDSSKRSHITLELESGETYCIPQEFLSDINNELLRGNKVDLWVEAKGYAEVMQLNINGNTIISKDLQEDWIKTWGKWLQRISFCLFIVGSSLLIVRKRLQNIEKNLVVEK